MKEIKDVIQNNYRFNNIDLERNFDNEMEDDTFKKIVSKIKLPKDEIIKYTSLIKDSSLELKNSG